MVKEFNCLGFFLAFFPPVTLRTISDESPVFYSIFFSMPFSPATFASSQCFSFMLCLHKTMRPFMDIHFVWGLQFHFSYHGGIISPPKPAIHWGWARSYSLSVLYWFLTAAFSVRAALSLTLKAVEVLKLFHRKETDRESCILQRSTYTYLLNRRSRSETVKYKAVISISAEAVEQVNTK